MRSEPFFAGREFVFLQILVILPGNISVEHEYHLFITGESPIQPFNQSLTIPTEQMSHNIHQPIVGLPFPSPIIPFREINKNTHQPDPGIALFLYTIYSMYNGCSISAYTSSLQEKFLEEKDDSISPKKRELLAPVKKGHFQPPSFPDKKIPRRLKSNKNQYVLCYLLL